MCTPSPFYSSLTCPNLGYKGWGDIEAAGHATNSFGTGAYFFYLLICKFFRWVLMAVSVYGIPHIIRLRTCLQMMRVNAFGIITFVTHYIPYGYRSVVYFIRQARGANDFSTSSSSTKYSVTTECFGTSPRPAFCFGKLFDFCPKASFNRASVNHKRDNTHVLQY